MIINYRAGIGRSGSVNLTERFSKPPLLRVSSLLLSLLLGGAIASVGNRSLAQITPDTTLGTQGSVITPNVNVGGMKAERIDGGAVRGANLFHSFLEFNVGEAQRVYFTNPAGIENILSRVTGNNLSKILGTLGVYGDANLFLLNPNGIIFGPNAKLDIAGSFVASTANSLVFENGLVFSATNPKAPPLLTIKLTPGVQYGSNQPRATITNAAHLAVGQNLTLAASNLDLQGQLYAGGNLTLFAQDTVQIRDSVGLPFLASAGGQLLVQGNQSVNIFALNHPNSGFFSGGDMVLRSAGTVGGDAHYQTGGGFRVERLDGSAGNLFSPNDPIVLANGDVTLGNYTGASLHILAGGSVTLGVVMINGTDTAANTISPSNPIYGSLANFMLSDGTPVTIDGSINPTLDVRAGINWALTPLGKVPGNTVRGSVSPTVGLSAISADITIGSILNTGGVVFLTNQYSPNVSLSGGAIRVTNFPVAIDTGNIGFGNGGPITINSRDSIQLVGGLISLVLAGGVSPSNGGNVTLVARGDITTGNGLIGGKFGIVSGSYADAGRGGDILLISRAGAINTSAGVLDASNVYNTNADAGSIRLIAQNNITTNDLYTYALDSGTGGGGNIQLQSIAGAISTGAVNSTAGRSDKPGGDILFIAGGNIMLNRQGASAVRDYTGEQGIGTFTHGSGKSGNITLLSDAAVSIEGIPIISWTSGSGLAGDIYIRGRSVSLTADSISGRQTELEASSFGAGQAGNILIEATNGGAVSIANSRLRDTVNSTGNGGNIQIKAGQIFLADNSVITTALASGAQGNGGNITLSSDGGVNAANSLIISGTAGVGNAGDINIQATSVALTDGMEVSAGTSGTGSGGNVTINASESLQLRGNSTRGNPSEVSAITLGNGDAGNVTINTGQLLLQDGAVIASSVGTLGNPSSGQGGNVTVNAASVELSGTSSDSLFPSRLATATFGTGDAGNLTVNTERLVVRDGALIATSTVSKGADAGKAGNLTVNAAESVELSGASANGQILSVLSTDTFGSGKAGELSINTRRLTIRDGAAASVSTFGSAQGGRMTVNASEQVELIGTAGNGFASGLYAQAFAGGNAGDLRVYTGQLIVRDRARIAVASGSASDTQVPTGQPNFTVPQNNAQPGDAGSLGIIAHSIVLDNQGNILASTASSEGGNIRLQVQDLLLMRHNSQISATAGTAQAGGNGGNITIDAQFIVAVPKENSDITANAFTGRGGNINITTQGIYGLQFRPRLTPLSDITASSEFGVNGTVQINTPDVDPSRGLAELPVEPVNVEVAQGCQAGGKPSSIAFFNTGRGGLAPNPYEPLSSSGIWEDVPSPNQGTENSASAASDSTSPTTLPEKIVEAQGWLINEQGEVVLVAEVPITRLQSRCRLR